MTIRNPIEWGWDQFKSAGMAMEAAGRSMGRIEQTLHAPLPAIRHIDVSDLREALKEGINDFSAYRTDVVFLCVIYPIVGMVLARLAFGHDLLPLLFPLASGFALIGPFAAIGLYEMSRRRELGHNAKWSDAFAMIREPSFGGIALLGLGLVAIFLLWLATASAIYDITLGPAPPTSASQFIRDIFTTSAGWAMIGIGIGVGFLFAVSALTISIVSFPLMLDRDAGFDTAVWTSIRAVAANPGPMALWGLIVAAGLVIGSIPLFVGLVVVMPVFGHATWHLYRRLIPR